VLADSTRETRQIPAVRVSPLSTYQKEKSEMLKRKLSTVIIAAVFMASPMIVPTFVLAAPQDGQQDKMKDDKMKDEKMQGDKMQGDKMDGDKMEDKKHRRHKKPKHKKDDKMQSNKNQ